MAAGLPLDSPGRPRSLNTTPAPPPVRDHANDRGQTPAGSGGRALSHSISTTSASLLVRLRGPNDQSAWTEFVRRYGDQMHLWCRKWKIQQADADDVVQSVLARLAVKLKSFEYDPARSFRGYLKTLTHYAWSDLLEGRRRAGGGTGDTRMIEVLESVEARTDLVDYLDREFDRELLEEATARVRQRIEAHTWEAFRLTAVDGLTGAAAAAQLGIKVATVFKAKSKVQRMLQEEIRLLEGPFGTAGEELA
ncbi:MAG: sigma-70 family polymerase sigma factor [Gemmataceae bacterium]|nr:sigma-70 family polymerase sigma factor [Gemmataceae bacterium]